MKRLDDLILGNLKIYQDTDEFRFSIDAVLLAHFVTIKEQFRYGELGTGTGAVALICSARGAQHIKAFEINEKTCHMARKSVAYNGLEGKIEVIQGDYRRAYEAYGNTFDGIFVNPPYFKVGTGRQSHEGSRSLALHEVETTLADVAQSVKRLLLYGGYCWMIYRSDQLAYAFSALRAEQLEPKRIRFVHSDEEKPSKLVLIEAKYGGKEGLIVEKPLYIYNLDGTYSKEVSAWYER